MFATNKDFSQYKKHQITLFKEMLHTYPKNQFDEQALPSYTNPNPLMRYLFWERIRFVIKYLSSFNKINTCLDFGCGLGTMIPYLSQKVQSLFVLDLDISLLQEIGEKEGWQNVAYLDSLEQLNGFEGKIDFILALDVLEHVDNLSEILLCFSELLTKDGFILVSGPTENIFYKIGRRLANYSGHYHTRNVYDVKDEMEKHFLVSSLKTLYKPIPFFEIYVAKRYIPKNKR